MVVNRTRHAPNLEEMFTDDQKRLSTIIITNTEVDLIEIFNNTVTT